jgi:predicted molibdopterin-dependent oxidoreductase YjgC
LQRLETTQRGSPLRLNVNGEEIEAYEGETVAAALMASGTRTLRRTALLAQPRGLFCGMGVCFDCLMQIDGRPNQQACLTTVADGMCVEIQFGDGKRAGQR